MKKNFSNKESILDRLSNLETLLYINQEFFDEYDFSLKERIEFFNEDDFSLSEKIEFFNESSFFKENNVNQLQFQHEEEEEEENITLLDLPPFSESFRLVGIGLLIYIFPLLKAVSYKYILLGFYYFSLIVKILIFNPTTLYIINKYELISHYFTN